MELLHSCLVGLSLDNHSAAVLKLAVGLTAVAVGEHMPAKYRINLQNVVS
jgi:hypothetical protein